MVIEVSLNLSVKGRDYIYMMETISFLKGFPRRSFFPIVLTRASFSLSIFVFETRKLGLSMLFRLLSLGISHRIVKRRLLAVTADDNALWAPILSRLSSSSRSKNYRWKKNPLTGFSPSPCGRPILPVSHTWFMCMSPGKLAPNLTDHNSLSRSLGRPTVSSSYWFFFFVEESDSTWMSFFFQERKKFFFQPLRRLHKTFLDSIQFPLLTILKFYYIFIQTRFDIKFEIWNFSNS